MAQEQAGRVGGNIQLMQPPYPGDGRVHVWVDGRALARCGHPDPVTIVRDDIFPLYPEDVRCVTRPDGSDGCERMLAAGEPGPAEWLW